MKIKAIEYENFRNFKNRGKVECSTDGRVTIVYGRNGDGKTTFHQLFQWVLYGQVHFNKTTNDSVLYNLQLNAELPAGNEFEVMGRIVFEHMGKEYTLRRTAHYYKESLFVTKYLNEELALNERIADNDWKPIDKPVDTIEKLLPSGLSEYFFFDGERMIADLSTKSDDSAKKLREALYSMFDLDILDMAIEHIGSTDLKKTVLGKLYLSKGDSSSSSETAFVKQNIENIAAKIEKLENTIEESTDKKEKLKQEIVTISEQIGSSKSKAEYERQRKTHQRNQEIAQKNTEQAQEAFGETIMSAYPKLLISKAILDASLKLKLKISKTDLPMGLGKTLIHYLISQENTTGLCICGKPLCEEDKKHIEDFLNQLPPKSYASLYQEFISTAKNWGTGHNRDKLEQYIKLVIDNNEQVEQFEEAVRALDSEQKKSADIEELVERRQKAESTIKELDERIVKAEVELKKAKIYLKSQQKEFDKLTENDEKAKAADKRIRIMEQVLANFNERLSKASKEYSKTLQDNIQNLLNTMMDNDRRVNVSEDFAVKVYDNFGDESKSEGQFAITSFAYIGGIFKMLQSEEHLKGKEYPLVLDGPFSKLDPTKIQNVVDVVPKFAPQVILFSKDSLQDVFLPEQIGRVYTIKSNIEQNVAEIKEGYLW